MYVLKERYIVYCSFLTFIKSLSHIYYKATPHVFEETVVTFVTFAARATRISIASRCFTLSRLTVSSPIRKPRPNSRCCMYIFHRLRGVYARAPHDIRPQSNFPPRKNRPCAHLRFSKRNGKFYIALAK